MDPQSANAAPHTQSSLVPETWPGGFGLFKTAKAAFMVNAGPNLILIAISIVLSIALPLVIGQAGRLLSEVISIALSVASTRLYLAGARGQKLSLGQAFPKDFMLYLKFVGLIIIVGLSIGVSLLLLIIPFFFVLPRLVLATYYLIDKESGVTEAYKASWEETKGHSGKVWGVFGASIVFGILCIVLIGFYLSIVYAPALTLLYLYLQNQHGMGGANPPVGTPAPAPVTAQPPVVPPATPPTDITPPQPPVTPTTPTLVQ